MKPSVEKITMYSTAWCSDSHRARIILNKSGIEFINIDIDQTPESVETVKEINGGHRSVPTIVFPDGSVLVEPSNKELREKLAAL